MYIPCNFDRDDYLLNSEVFEKVVLETVENELTEFSEDVEDLAFELAYTRYRLAKMEKVLAQWLECVDTPNEWHRCRNNAKVLLGLDAEPNVLVWA